VSHSDTTWGLVLAGGRSRRMGTDKALLRRDGETQLARTVMLLEKHLPRVFVSTRADQVDDEERARYPQIRDRYDDLGPVAGILSAMEEHPEVAWLVVACDLPNVDDVTIQRLLDERDAGRPFTAYRSSYDGLPEPLCAIYSPAARDIVVGFVEDGINCPRKILIRSDTELMEQSDPGSLDNINTPEDLATTDVRLRP